MTPEEVTPPGDFEGVEVRYTVGAWELHTSLGEGWEEYTFFLEPPPWWHPGVWRFISLFDETYPREDEGRDFPPHPAGPDSHRPEEWEVPI